MARHGPERTLQPSCPRPHATVCTLPKMSYIMSGTRARGYTPSAQPLCAHGHGFKPRRTPQPSSVSAYFPGPGSKPQPSFTAYDLQACLHTCVHAARFRHRRPSWSGEALEDHVEPIHGGLGREGLSCADRIGWRSHQWW